LLVGILGRAQWQVNEVESRHLLRNSNTFSGTDMIHADSTDWSSFHLLGKFSIRKELQKQSRAWHQAAEDRAMKVRASKMTGTLSERLNAALSLPSGARFSKRGAVATMNAPE